ncbi:MAG: hypothetical protein K2Q13_03780 [Nitrosomonas sp.]|uniref:hypothetical protein n=1 Tax=Nitrosomonas sp. TaxID=42353 RepID=UPI0025FC2A3B|nr:hypothetical protein [Nitrosomonas sp.]MBY0474166.1 hypothetical protein [Nitrosomonas sp.]
MQTNNLDVAHKVISLFKTSLDKLNKSDFNGSDEECNLAISLLAKQNEILGKGPIPLYVALRIGIPNVNVLSLPDIITGLYYIKGMLNIHSARYLEAREYFAAASEFAYRRLLLKANPIDTSEVYFWLAIFHEALSARMSGDVQGLLYARSLIFTYKNTSFIQVNKSLLAGYSNLSKRIEKELTL